MTCVYDISPFFALVSMVYWASWALWLLRGLRTPLHSAFTSRSL